MGMKVYRSGDFDRRQDARQRQRQRRPRRRLRGRWLVWLLVALVVAALVYLAWPFGAQRVVLLGSDARADETSRSDTIVVVKGGGGMLAVPRDTRLEIPGVGEDKINAAFASGGPKLAVQTIENLTGKKTRDYAIIDFGGVEDIVDAMGGITINVEEPMQGPSQDGEPISIPAGEQELNGSEALSYVRFRGTPSADIGRIGRQQRFLQALASQSVSPEKLPRLPQTAWAIWRNLETNMNPLEAALFAARIGLSGIGNVEIYPGTPQYIDGVAYWVPDREAGKEAVTRTIE